MTNVIKFEETAMFIASLILIPYFDFNGWLFAICFLLPDVGMLGYLHNARTGCITYNIFHHKAIALLIGVSGVAMDVHWLTFTGLLLFSHSSFDRMLGYGLKYKKGFAFTHMGKIGAAKTES